jgi:hypothetical protein
MTAPRFTFPAPAQNPSPFSPPTPNTPSRIPGWIHNSKKAISSRVMPASTLSAGFDSAKRQQSESNPLRGIRRFLRFLFPLRCDAGFPSLWVERISGYTSGPSTGHFFRLRHLDGYSCGKLLYFLFIACGVAFTKFVKPASPLRPPLLSEEEQQTVAQSLPPSLERRGKGDDSVGGTTLQKPAQRESTLPSSPPVDQHYSRRHTLVFGFSPMQTAFLLSFACIRFSGGSFRKETIHRGWDGVIP